MKYDAALFTALAVSMASVQAAPAQEPPHIAFTPSDPFVACVQKTFPNFPKEGNPTTEQLRACFPGAHPLVARELVSQNATDDFDPAPALQSRGWPDTVQVLGEILGLDQKSKCELEHGSGPTTLHDEFVWVEDVINAADDLCNDALKIIETTGLKEDGGVAYASRQFSNAFDKQSNYLHHNRNLLLTMAIDFYPPASVARDQIKNVAQGVRDLCKAGVLRLMDPRDGCATEVSWYNSGRVHWDKHLAAVGGRVGLFFGGSNTDIGDISLGFSEDSN